MELPFNANDRAILAQIVDSEVLDATYFHVKSRSRYLEQVRLSLDEVVGLRLYTSAPQVFEPLNKQLHAGILTPEFEAFNTVLQRIHAKMPIVEADVFRGVEVSDLGKITDVYRTGRTVQWRGWTSATVFEENAFYGNVRFRWRTRRGRAVMAYSAKPDESEVLLAPASEFMVTGCWQWQPHLVVVFLEEAVDG